MATTKLKRSLGTDGQSLTDESSGLDGLKAVLQALAKGEGRALDAHQATPSAAVVGGFVADRAGDYDYTLKLNVGTTGTGGQTDVDLNVNGAQEAQVTVTNAEADGTTNTVTGTVTLAENDVVTLEVTAVATGSPADLTATARVKALEVE